VNDCSLNGEERRKWTREVFGTFQGAPGQALKCKSELNVVTCTHAPAHENLATPYGKFVHVGTLEQFKSNIYIYVYIYIEGMQTFEKSV
jgi:hypothetical protein